MKRRFAVIMAALLIAAMAGCSQSGTSSTAEQSTAQSSADSSVAESAESEISEAESSVVSEVTSTESSDEKSDTSAAESSESKSKTESSQSKTEESSKKETSKAETSKTETSKTESSKPESSKAEEPKVTGINLDMSSLSMTAGNSYELNAYILWSNGTSSYQGITWSTSNNGVASVSGSGYVTANSAGTATITASYGSFKQSCTVTVKAAQSSQPSGGGNEGSSGNGGSSGGNGGSTSKPAEDPTTWDDYDLGTSSKPSQTVDDGSPVLTDEWFKENCRAIKTEDGTIVYEFPQLMDYINEYRRDMGVPELTWHGSEELSYEQVLENLKDVKNDRMYKIYGVDYLMSEYPGCFDSDGNIILTEEYYNEHYANQSNGIAEEAVYCSIHGCGHELHYASANVTEDIGYTMKQFIEDIRVNSPGHFNTWVRKENRNFYACVAIRGDRFFVSSQ